MNTNCNLIKSMSTVFKKSLGAFLNLLFIHSFKTIKNKPNVVWLVAVLFLLGLYTNQLNAQNPGQAANFSIKADTYSGAFNSVSDDWFQGPNGNGMIDESQTAAWTAITNAKSNQAFTARSKYNQYQVVDGYLLYDAIYGRDHVNLSGSNDFTSFAGSSGKNGDNPQTTWVVDNTGSPTSTVDLLDVYAHIRREGSTVGQNMWLDMAVSTLGNTGTHYVDFELFTTDLALNGAGGFQESGDDLQGGHTAWSFDGSGNITGYGDLVAGFAYSGSTIQGVELRIWVKRSDFENVTPAGFSWGAECDGDSNGSTYGYAQVIIPPGGKFDSGNPGNVSGPPWKTFSGGEPSFTYDNGAFAEVGINLSVLGVDPSVANSNPCDPPFKKILVKSRSSASFTSNLKDFAGPYEFLASPLVDTTIDVEAPGHFLCEAEQLQLSPLNPYNGAYYVYTTLDGEFLDGTQEFIGENAIITKPGTYKLTGSPAAGCTITESYVTIYAQPCAIDDDMGEIIENSSTGVKLKVTFNDTDLDDDIDKTTLNNDSPLLQPTGGTLIINFAGDITYIPNPDFYGPDSFEYQICDDQGFCDTALVTVMVLQDSDDDGTGDIYDLDNDNDGIPDTIECAVVAKPRILNADFEAVNIVSSGLDEGPTDVVAGYPGIWKGDESNIPNWESTDTSSHLEIWNNAHNLRNGAGHDRDGKAYSGSQWAEVNASSNNGLYQDIITTPGDVLQWSFAHRKRVGFKNSANEDIVSLEIGAPGSTISQGNFTSHPFSIWTKHTGTYTVPAGQTVTRLTFTWVQSASGNATQGNFIDAVELYFVDTGCADSDGDGVPNNLDLDSDNDGIPDVLEAGFEDANNDGLVDTSNYGNNGLANEVETFADSGALAVLPLNSDESTDISAGMYDFLDVDSDNDGITDTKEAFSDNIMYNDADNDGLIDGYFDIDINGWFDTIDAEPTFPVRRNSDSDAFPDYLDIDSDNDGIPDTVEGNIDVLDADNNGIVGDGIPNDEDFDGLADTNDPDFTGNVLGGSGFYQDTDGDGLNNTIDIDADNDGIIDNTEGSSTFAYIAPAGTDTDGDGLDDAYDVDNGGTAIGYVNIDGGMNPDYLDVDSDGDGIKDIRENNIVNTADADVLDLNNDGMVDPTKFTDADGDGLADEFDLINGKTNTLNGTNNNQTPNSQPDADPQNPGGDRDWREWYGQDTDLDLIPDYLDLDDDNDGILDTVEEAAADTDIDNDGIPNLLDLDSDGDGIPDHTDAGGTFDYDNSGMPGTGILTTTDKLPPPNAALFEVDANGVPTLVGPTGISPLDSDGDGLPNYLDLDSDNDGILDVIEAGGNDANGDGIYGPGTSNDIDSDGIADAIDLFDNTGGNADVLLGGTPLTVPDSDGDLIKNFQDLDSDNDAIPDIVEGQPTIGYVAPLGSLLDTDGDGINDRFDIDSGGTPIVPVDTDSDYTPDYLDLDSDGDFLFDIAESGATRAAADGDNDGKTDNTVGANGLDNTFELLDTYADPNGTLDDTQFDNFPDEDSDVFSGGDVDYRDGGVEDFDGDTVPDAIDLDDDDDGILDTDESYGANPNADDDGDGLSNYLDPDFCTLNAFGICANLDIDNDGIPNHFDLDSDGDGCNDAMEAYNDATVDPDFDGIWGSGVPVVDANGLVIAAGVTGSTYDTTPADTDTSTIADFLESTIFVACLSDLSITKTVDNTTPQINDIVTFTITIFNSGPFTTSGIKLRDLLPSELAYNATNSTIPPSTSYDSSTGVWDLSSITLGINASIQIQIAATASASCSLTTNEAEIISSKRFDLDSTPDNNNIAEDDYDTATLTVTDTTDPTWTSTLPVNGTYQCNAVPAPVTLTATDNCGTATVTYNEVRTNGSCDSNYTLTRTWTATDCCGANSISHVQTLNVIDTTAPTASDTTPLTVQCFSTIPAADPNVVTGESDNCSSNVTVAFLSESNNGGAGTTTSPYVLTRIYRVSDDCGNYIDVPHQITVIDNTAPVIDTAAFDLAVQCDGLGNNDELNNWLATNGSAAATDNCGTLTWTNDYTGLVTSCGSNASATVTFTATDDHGNSATTTATFSIVDNISPEILGFHSTASNEQSLCEDIPVLTFTSYSEESGDGNNATFLQGEVFRFPNVYVGADALLTIVDIVNATIPVLDDNSNGPNALKPQTRFALTNVGDRAYVEYRIDFVEAGTSTPKSLPEFSTNFNDIDGTNNYREVNWTELTTSYTVNDPTELTITQEDPWLVATSGPITYNGTANTNPQINISTRNMDASSYSFRVGAEAITANVPSTMRQHNIEFACIGNYTSAHTFKTVTMECQDVEAAPILTATDDCSLVDVVYDEVRTDGSCDNQYTLVRTYTATDECGNEAKATLTINVIDTTNPTWIDTPSDASVECDGTTDPSGAFAAWLTSFSGEDCGASAPTITNNSTGLSDLCGATGSETVTFTLTDACGNSITQDATFTIVDTTDPVLSGVPGDITVECDNIPVAATPTATDTCDAAPVLTLSETTTVGSCPTLYTLTRTWTATDACGNTSSASQNITVRDTTDPTISVPVDSTVECGDSTDPTATGTATGSDACGAVTITYTDSSTQTSNGSCTDYVYTITRTWTATDTCSNTNTAVQTITVEDTIAPTGTTPADASYQCISDVPAADTAAVTDEADNCGGPVTVTVADTNNGGLGTTSSPYIVTRTYTLTDCVGLTTNLIQTITVIDNIAPTITCPGNINQDVDAGTCSANIIYTAPTGTDNCSGATTVQIAGLPSGSAFPVGTTTNTFEVTDAAGLKATSSFDVTVNDTQAPAITCPADIVVSNDTDSCDAVVTYVAPVGTDNCAGATTALLSGPASGSTFPLGTTTVTYEVTDAAGNKTQCSFDVTVNDTQAPAITCPADIVVSNDTDS
ncbi:HYR domain-containing protein, partial [Algibacter luteus]